MFPTTYGEKKIFSIYHARLSGCICVCPKSLASVAHYYTDPDVTRMNGIGLPPSCALLGGFAMGARVSLL